MTPRTSNPKRSRIPERKHLVANLGPVGHAGKSKGADDLANDASICGSILLLARIDPTRVYELCRAVATHLLEKVPEPEDLGIDENEEEVT